MHLHRRDNRLYEGCSTAAGGLIQGCKDQQGEEKHPCHSTGQHWIRQIERAHGISEGWMIKGIAGNGGQRGQCGGQPGQTVPHETAEFHTKE